MIICISTVFKRQTVLLRKKLEHHAGFRYTVYLTLSEMNKALAKPAEKLQTDFLKKPVPILTAR